MFAVSERTRPVPVEGLFSFNRLFRWLLLLLGYLVAMAFWQFSNNGHYMLYSNEQGVIRLDTRTGEASFPVMDIPHIPPAK